MNFENVKIVSKIFSDVVSMKTFELFSVDILPIYVLLTISIFDILLKASKNRLPRPSLLQVQELA